jgi:hypothetical protein
VEELLSLRLAELRWLSTDRCLASFESSAGERYDTAFTVSRRDGVATAADDEALMNRIDGSAADLRAIVEAVISFCDAAQQTPSL